MGDSAYTFKVGEVDGEAGAAARNLRGRALGRDREGTLGRAPADVSHAIQTATEDAGFSVVRPLVGHGVGRDMHEDPQIPNFGDPGPGPCWPRG